MVDMRLFFKYYKFVEPVFKPEDPTPEKERLMDPSAVPELELIYQLHSLCCMFWVVSRGWKKSRVFWDLQHLPNFTDST